MRVADLSSWKFQMKACLLTLALLVLPLQACVGPIPPWNVSAGSMASEGKKAPDLDVIRIGATRAEVELALGSPLSIKSSSIGDDGTSVYVYEYEIGNEPSDLRAVAHITMSILTFGLWEIRGTEIESQGERYHLSITYDQDGIVTAISTKMVEAGI